MLTILACLLVCFMFLSLAFGWYLFKTGKEKIIRALIYGFCTFFLLTNTFLYILSFFRNGATMGWFGTVLITLSMILMTYLITHNSQDNGTRTA